MFMMIFLIIIGMIFLLIARKFIIYNKSIKTLYFSNHTFWESLGRPSGIWWFPPEQWQWFSCSNIIDFFNGNIKNSPAEFKSVIQENVRIDRLVVLLLIIGIIAVARWIN